MTVLKGRLLKAVERTLSCGVASKTKTENKYKDTSDSSEAEHSETTSPPGHFASDLARIGAVEVLFCSTYVSRSHLFSRILLLFIGFVPIWCTSRAFTIGIYTVKLGNAWDQGKK